MKHHKTLKYPAIQCKDIGARCGDIGARRGDIGTHRSDNGAWLTISVLARSFRRLQSWYNSADV